MPKEARSQWCQLSTLAHPINVFGDTAFLNPLQSMVPSTLQAITEQMYDLSAYRRYSMTSLNSQFSLATVGFVAG